MPSDSVNPWLDRLKELYYQEPFRPFVIRTKQGASYKVPHPLHVMFAPFLRTIHVSVGPGEVTTVIESVDVIEIKEAGRGRRKSGKSGSKR